MKNSISIIFGLLLAISSPAYSEGNIAYLLNCNFIEERAGEAVTRFRSTIRNLKDPAWSEDQKKIMEEMLVTYVDEINTMSNAYIAFCKPDIWTNQ